MRNRMEEIKSKGFNVALGNKEDYDQPETFNNVPLDFNKIRMGAKVLNDAVLNLGDLKKVDSKKANKHTVQKAIADGDLATMREISEFFYKTSGIYNRIIRYMAYMYRYDWYVTPYVNNTDTKIEKLQEGFTKCLRILDNFGVKKTLGDIALKTLKYGAYYGYKIKTSTGNTVLQELPPNYCRTITNFGNKPAVEFNMKYFDDAFRDTALRNKIIKLFPQEFGKGYSLYRQGKLVSDFPGDKNGWYLLDPEMTVKFNINGEDYPPFISVIPLIIDLDEAQDLDKKKTMQRLLKIIVQKIPTDKNGDFLLDVEESQQLHNNAVQMLGRAIGVDVLTTFAEVEVANLSDSNVSSAQSDDLARVERQVFNEAGVSQNQFNSTGNLALNNSLLNDAASMYSLLLQFEAFLNELIVECNSQPKKVEFRAQILTTTIYNYQELAKLYKEQTQLGYSKMLPQIALGQSQSSVLANAYFENEVLDLVNLFIPPLMSSTMNSDILGRKNAEAGTGNSDNKGGRTEKPDNEKSEKTIANQESMS